MKWCTFVVMLGLPCTWGLYGGIRRRWPFRQIRPLSFVITPEFNCSGSLIHIQWVITSAQCFFYHPSPHDVYVMVSTGNMYYRGNDTRDNTRTGLVVRKPVKIIYQEMQNVPDGRGREAALVRLNSQVYSANMQNQHYLASYLARGPFPTDDQLNKYPCNHGGMGFDGNPTINTARYVRIYAPDGTYCRKFINTPGFYKELCIKRNPGRGACNGDWGGPILCYNDLVTTAILWRPVHRNGSWARPYHCARGDVVEAYVYTGAVLRFVKYYIPDLQRQYNMYSIARKGKSSKQCSTNTIIFFTIYFVLCI